MDNLTKIAKYAMEEVNRSLREAQNRILLLEKFGDDAVTWPQFFKPGTKRGTRELKDEQENYDNLMEFAKKLQEFIDKSDDIRFQKDAEAFIKNHF